MTKQKLKKANEGNQSGILKEEVVKDETKSILLDKSLMKKDIFSCKLNQKSFIIIVFEIVQVNCE